MGKAVANPYKIGPPVKGKDFYGREDLLAQVRHQLGSSNAILLQGQRRIGKTSFLHQLHISLTTEGAADEGFLLLLFDIQRYVNDTLPQFQEHLAKTIAKELHLPVPSTAEWESNPALFHETWLPKMFECLGSRQLVLLVDEFDNLGEWGGGRSVETLVPFIGYLVANEVQLKWVFAVGRHIGKLPIQYDSIVDRAVKLRIGRLTPEETQQLICEPASGVVIFQPAAVERIHQLTGGQPHLTQAVCGKVFERVLDEGRGTVTSEDVDAILTQTLDAYEGAIASIARVPPIEERVLAVVAQLTKEEQTASRDDIIQLILKHHIPFEREEVTDALNRLVEWDLLAHDDQRWRLTIEIVRIWVEKNMPLEPSREKELDLLKTRAQSHYEFAEKARHTGHHEIAIEDYEEALKYMPTLREALRGLAETYRLTGCLAGRTETLQKLFQQDPTVLPELVDALADYAQQCEREGKVTIAAKQYEALLTLQDSDRWRQGLVQACLREANNHLGETTRPTEERSFHLAEAREVIEYGLAVVSQGVEVKKLKWKLEEIKQKELEEWISSRHEQTKAAEVKGNWKMVGQSLLDLQEAGIKLTTQEARTLQKAAWQSLYDQNSFFYRRISWLKGRPTWFKSLVGAWVGLIEALLLVNLVQEVTTWNVSKVTIWGAPIYALLIALNIGLVKALARQHAMRILAVHFVVGSATAGLLLLTKSLFEFPPSNPLHYIILIVMVATPLASVACFETSFAYEKAKAGIANSFFTFFGGFICALLGWVLAALLKTISNLPNLLATGLGLGVGWTLVALIMEIGDPALHGVNLKDIHLIFGR